MLPPQYTLKQTRQELNASLEIERKQGHYPGAFISLLDTWENTENIDIPNGM